MSSAAYIDIFTSTLRRTLYGPFPTVDAAEAYAAVTCARDATKSREVQHGRSLLTVPGEMVIGSGSRTSTTLMGVYVYDESELDALQENPEEYDYVSIKVVEPSKIPVVGTAAELAKVLDGVNKPPAWFRKVAVNLAKSPVLTQRIKKARTDLGIVMMGLYAIEEAEL